MLVNSKALFEEDGGIDHHVDVVLWLAQRVVVVVYIHLHCLTQSLHSNSCFFSPKSVENLKKKN